MAKVTRVCKVLSASVHVHRGKAIVDGDTVDYEKPALTIELQGKREDGTFKLVLTGAERELAVQEGQEVEVTFDFGG